MKDRSPVIGLEDLRPHGTNVNGFPLMEFDRRSIDPHPLRGFALKWNKDLTLLQILEQDTYSLNGYTILRNKHIRRWRLIAKDEFYARAAIKKRLRPADLGNVSIASIKDAIQSAGTAFPLLTLYEENTKKHVCYIGSHVKSTQRAVTLRDLGPDVVWGGLDTYAYRDITRIQFGGAYESLLIRLAPALPIAKLPQRLLPPE